MAEAATQPAPTAPPRYTTAKIVFAGTVGGLVYWTLLTVGGVHPFNLQWYKAIPISILFGAVAAYLGVYWLTNMETSDPQKLRHACAFALLCGIFWGPVFQGAKQDFTSAIGASDAQSAQKQIASLEQQLNSANSADVKQAIATTVDTTTQALNKSPNIQDDSVKQNIQDASIKTATTLAETAKAHPEVSIEGLEKLGQAAAAAKNAQVLNAVTDSLAQVERTNPNVAAKASQARQSVSRAAGLRAPSAASAVVH